MQWVIVATTTLLTVFTGIYMVLTYRLLKESEKSRLALAQSELFAYVSEVKSNFFLTIKNSGRAPAKDITVTFDPPFKLLHPSDHLLSELVYFGLEPGQSRHYLLAKGTDIPRQYSVVITWNCILSGDRKLVYPIDLDSWNFTVARRINTTRTPVSSNR